MPSDPILVFDVETVPDVEGLRKLYELSPDESAETIAEIAFHKRRQKTETILTLHLQRVVAIACALRDRDQFKVWSLGSETTTERN